MAKKSFFALIILLLLFSGSWYFFFKEYDFTVRFETEVAPGIAYNKVKAWQYQEIKAVKTDHISLFKELEQQVTFENSTFLLHWTFSPENDSITVVTVHTKSTDSPLNKRLNFLFGNDEFREKIEGEILQIMKTLKADSELYKISIEEENMSPGTYCACISLESEVDKKAFRMMATINYLSGFVLENNLETNGRPRVQVNNWNPEKNIINFDFCFPVEKPTTEPQDSVIFFKEISPFPSLKATYFGNYMFSHYAWLELMNYAGIHGIEISKSPLEIFHNNPEMGGDPLNWRAEIYLPLKD